jgi:hypothetical protein
VYLLAGITGLTNIETLLLASPTIEAGNQAIGNYTITCTNSTKFNNVNNPYIYKCCNT